MVSGKRTVPEEAQSALTFAMRLHPVAEQIIHLGAGRARWLAELERCFSCNILLVEALPKAAVRLQDAWALNPAVEIVRAAVSDFSGKGILREYNVSSRTSLKQPGNLARSYPGLRVKREHEVDVICIDHLLEPYLAGDQIRHLIVDLPGEIYTVIQVLAKTGLLSRFRRITLCGDLRPQYEDEAPIGDALDLLQQHCFDVIQSVSGDEGLGCQWTLAFNSAMGSLEQANSRIAQLEEQLNSARAQIEQIILTADHQRATEQRLIEILESHRMSGQGYSNE